MSRTPEGIIKLKLKKYLESIGAYQFWPVQTGYGRKTLDVIICFRGRYIIAETKSDGNDLKPHQKVIRDEAVKAGALFFKISNDSEFGAFVTALRFIP